MAGPGADGTACAHRSWAWVGPGVGLGWRGLVSGTRPVRAADGLMAGTRVGLGDKA